MVQKIESDSQGERVAGLKGPDRTQSPTAGAPEFPESPQDRQKGSYRPSKWKRLTQVGVCNDDASPIAEKTDKLLEQMIATLELLRTELRIAGVAFKPSGSKDAVAVSDVNPLPVELKNEAEAPSTCRASFAHAAVSGDSVVIFGRDDKVIKLREVVIAKPTAAQTVVIIKRNTADSGGTSTLATNVPMDISDGGSGTVVRLYTAAPTVGTAVGNIFRCAVAPSELLVVDFARAGVEPPTLRNASECLAINVDATSTLPGSIEWTEEAP